MSVATAIPLSQSLPSPASFSSPNAPLQPLLQFSQPRQSVIPSTSLAPKPDVDSQEARGMRQGRSKLSVLSELPVSKGFGLRGKMSDAVSLRTNTHGKLAMGVGHRSFEARSGRSFVTDAPCRLAFDEFSPQRCSETVNSDLDVWQLDERSGTAAAASSPSDRAENDAMPSLVPCNSPEVGSFTELGSNWEGFEFRGKMSDAVYHTHNTLAMGVGHRSFGAREGRSLANVAPCRLAFDEFSPQGCSDNVNSDLDVWQWDERSGTAAAGLSPSELDVWQWDERLNTAAAGLSPSDMAHRNPNDALLSPLPCKSPEVCTPSFTDWGLNWEDNVAQEWFQSAGRSSFETFTESSKTPEAQPSISPELTKRAMAGPAPAPTPAPTAAPTPAPCPGSGAGNAGPSPQQTPSPQPTNSPEFLKRSSVPPSSGGCFGAGPLMGPEGTSVKDRRKCKPRGILTIESELLFGSGSSNFEELQISETIPVPALASVEWMVAEGGGDGAELASVEWMLAESYDELESSEVVLASPGSISEEPFSVPYHGTLLLDASFATY